MELVINGWTRIGCDNAGVNLGLGGRPHFSHYVNTHMRRFLWHTQEVQFRPISRFPLSLILFYAILSSPTPFVVPEEI